MGKGDKLDKEERTVLGSTLARLTGARSIRPNGPIDVEFTLGYNAAENVGDRFVKLTIAPGEDPWEVLKEHLRVVGHLKVGQTRYVDIRKRE